MRLADLSVDDSTRQAIPVSEAIAKGAGNAPMILPSAATNAGTSVGSPNSVTNGVLMDDDDDEFLQAETSPFDINDAFDEHTSNFRGRKPKPRKPGTSIAKLPASKAKPAVSSPVEVFLDSNGDEYEYLGQFDGNTEFLDEKYKGVVAKPGDHLYRKQIGAQFDGQAQFEYFIGDDPETSAVFGKIFKGIGKAIKKVGKFAGKGLKAGFKLAKKAIPFATGGAGVGIAANVLSAKRSNINPNALKGFKGVFNVSQSNGDEYLTDFFWKKNTNTLGNSTNSTIKSLSFAGENYEYVGQSNGDLSFLTEIEPGANVIPGDHIYRVQRTEAFDGDQAEFDYYVGEHPDYSNGIGSLFKKIGKGIGKAAKAVGKGISKAVKATGKGIGNAAKFTVKKVIPLLTGAQMATPDESNGVIPPYNPTAGFEQGGGSDDIDWGDGMYQEQLRSTSDNYNVASDSTNVSNSQSDSQSTNPALKYVLIGAAILGVIVYLKNNK